MQKKEPDKMPEMPVYWFETSESISRRYQFEHDGHLSVSFVCFNCIFMNAFMYDFWLSSCLSYRRYGVLHKSASTIT